MKYVFPSPTALLLGLVLVFTGISAANAASFEVFMVRGDILYEGSGEQLAAGTTLASGERVKFKDKEAFAVLIGTGGRYTMSGANLGSKFKADEFVTVKNATVPGKFGLAARVQPEFKSKEDIAKYMGSGRYLLLREAELKISAATLNLTEDVEFVLRITKAGELVPVTKKLHYKNGILSINGDEILSAGRPEQLSGYKLMLFTAVGAPMEEIAQVDLVVPDEGGTFRDEISLLTEKLRSSMGEDGMGEEGMKQQILDYLVEYYGTPERGNFESWVIEFL